MATTIQVSDPVKEQLDDIKDRNEHYSYDSVLRSLIREFDDE